MKIKKVEIQAFRAYKFKEDGTFDFTTEGDKPSNFVAIYAPNGFGKTSFYDAVEWAITNNVERIAGEYNRKNNELAAKSTKQEGIGQKILRNKDVPDNVPTSVTVFTTWKPFARKLKRPRSDSRDIPIRDNKHREACYFSQVILSQDAIDRFLKEAKPQERYAQFMNYFGGEAEVARQELTVLINDNYIVLQDLCRQHAEIEVQLQEPVDTSVFEQFNYVATDLNLNGENVTLVSKDFSAQAEHEILAFNVTRTHELTVLQRALRTTQESLLESKALLPEVQINIDFIAEQKPRLAKLTKGVTDAQRYQELMASHAKCIDDLQSVSQQLANVLEIKGLVPTYLTSEAEIRAAGEKQERMFKERAVQAAAFNELEIFVKQHADNLAVADARSLSIRTVLDHSSQTYAEIATHQTGLVKLRAQSAEKEITLSLDKAEQKNVKDEIEKILAVNITVDSLQTQDISQIGFNQERLDVLNSLSKELITLEAHDHTIRQTQEALNQQMGLHERLISTGLEFLSISPTDICPLCRKLHGSASDLRNAVENNDLVSRLIRDNTRQLEESTARQNNLKAEINSISLEALTFQNQRIASLQAKVNELGKKISATEQERTVILALIGSSEKHLEALQDSVWRLEKEELIRRTETELSNLATIRAEHLAHLTQINSQVEDTKSRLADIDSATEALKFWVVVTASPCVRVVEKSPFSGFHSHSRGQEYHHVAFTPGSQGCHFK